MDNPISETPGAKLDRAEPRQLLKMRARAPHAVRRRDFELGDARKRGKQDAFDSPHEVPQREWDFDWRASCTDGTSCDDERGGPWVGSEEQCFIIVKLNHGIQPIHARPREEEADCVLSDGCSKVQLYRPPRPPSSGSAAQRRKIS